MGRGVGESDDRLATAADQLVVAGRRTRPVGPKGLGLRERQGHPSEQLAPLALLASEDEGVEPDGFPQLCCPDGCSRK